MANLKLIRVTGTPFSDACMGCIGIQTSSEDFEIIMDGRTWSQTSSFGQGYEPATKTDIERSWSTIYPHWTPEPGDKVIITQNYEDWANCKGTIVEEYNSYYKVKREDGCMAAFDSCEMILAPYCEPEKKLEQYHLHGFKLGDRITAIEIDGIRAGKHGTIVHFHQGHVGVSFDENIGANDCNGHCPYGRGWYLQVTQVEHYVEPKIKEETVTIKFLTEQQFREKGLWNRYGPKGWNNIGEMNKYLGRSAVIPKSSIGSNGSFSYEGWTFKVTDYIITEWILSKVDDFRDVSRTIANSSGAIGSSEPAKRLVIKGISAASDSNPIFVNGKSYPVSSDSVYPTAIIGKIDTDPLSLYKQKPITIKAKPKTKLTTI
jgi:hypothetical protein